MARREFPRFEAVSAVVPVEGGYNAALAVKALGAPGAPRFHTVLEGQVYASALAADEAASGELQRLKDIGDEGELVW
ncbi:hypothetical protein [Pseudomonas capeferrum]|uniref:hypothetical protein n=1 Tax=Pseudomonas capeferrum TaxID=1495066 RepID=UPI0021595863|nr:hypothetical protein [Pseudomonas capeferrum]